MSISKTNNIIFLLDENIDENVDENVDENDNFEKMMIAYNNISTNTNNDVEPLLYFKGKEFYGNDALFYNELNIKSLIKICEYYGIDKFVKASKCKKQYIIDTIIFFENQIENYEIVEKRHRMWAYMTELMNDKYMNKYIIW